MDQSISPAEAIEAVRRHRGDVAGPPPDVVMRNDHLPAPEPGGQPESADTAPAAKTSLARGLGVENHETLAAPDPRRDDGVSLGRREGMFEGHVIMLNEDELKRLRGFLAEVAQRQLEEEFKRLKQHRIRGKEAI